MGLQEPVKITLMNGEHFQVFKSRGACRPGRSVQKRNFSQAVIGPVDDEGKLPPIFVENTYLDEPLQYDEELFPAVTFFKKDIPPGEFPGMGIFLQSIELIIGHFGKEGDFPQQFEYSGVLLHINLPGSSFWILPKIILFLPLLSFMWSYMRIEEGYMIFQGCIGAVYTQRSSDTPKKDGCSCRNDHGFE